MDDEMQTTIKKIKLQEQDKETELKEKRAIEATLASLKRHLNETMLLTKRLKEELLETTARADRINAQLITAQALRSTLAAQLEASTKELEQLKIETEQNISKIWEQRDTLCNEVQKVSDQCDVWALFTKPKFIEISKAKKLPNENTNQANQQKRILENAQKRRQSLIAERDRLMNEPDSGEEFKRIKNALRYILDMAAQNKKE